MTIQDHAFRPTAVLPVTENGYRADHLLVAQMVEPGSRVLDVGCGEGDLLRLLANGGKLGGIVLSDRQTVESNDGNILRHPHPVVADAADGADGKDVRHGEYGGYSFAAVLQHAVHGLVSAAERKAGGFIGSHGGMGFFGKGTDTPLMAKTADLRFFHITADDGDLLMSLRDQMGYRAIGSGGVICGNAGQIFEAQMGRGVGQQHTGNADGRKVSLKVFADAAQKQNAQRLLFPAQLQRTSFSSSSM